MDNEFETAADDIFELEIGFAIVNLMMFENMNYNDARKQAIIEWKEVKELEKEKIMKIDVLKNVVFYLIIFVLMGIVISLPMIVENIK